MSPMMIFHGVKAEDIGAVRLIYKPIVPLICCERKVPLADWMADFFQREKYYWLLADKSAEQAHFLLFCSHVIGCYML